jgi:hypothetical protein
MGYEFNCDFAIAFGDILESHSITLSDFGQYLTATAYNPQIAVKQTAKPSVRDTTRNNSGRRSVLSFTEIAAASTE